MWCTSRERYRPCVGGKALITNAANHITLIAAVQAVAASGGLLSEDDVTSVALQPSASSSALLGSGPLIGGNDRRRRRRHRARRAAVAVDAVLDVDGVAVTARDVKAAAARITEHIAAGGVALPVVEGGVARILAIDASTTAALGYDTVTYAWEHGAWGLCSALCGNGTQARTVACVARGPYGPITARNGRRVCTKPGEVEPVAARPADRPGNLDCYLGGVFYLIMGLSA